MSHSVPLPSRSSQDPLSRFNERKGGAELQTFESLQSRPQGYLTLAHQDMETIKLLPPTFAELKTLAREWVNPPPGGTFLLRAPIGFISAQAARLIQGPYLWINGEDVYQLAQTMYGMRVEIVTDVPPEAEEYVLPPLKVEGNSQKGIKRHRARKSRVHKYPSQLLELLGLEERSIGLLRGKEAADLGTKLHSYLRICSEDPTEYATVLKLLQDLCSTSGELPSSYRLDNVTFDRKDLIGAGGEASVYGGYFNGQRVVVREVVMPRKNWHSPAGQNIIKLIHREVITHSQLDHPNIIPLYGVFHENTDAPPIMVLHYAEKGSLSDLIDIKAIKDIEFAWIITGVGRALTYLHSRKPPIFHGDLHTDNVLIDASGNALLCDFGLSRIRHEVTRTRTNIREGGRTRFMAPELLAGAEKFRTSPASDIFSLSMIFWNAWTRKLPFAELTNELKAEAAIRNGERPDRPTAAATATAELEPRLEPIDSPPEPEPTDLSPESEPIDLSPESEHTDLSPESEQIDLPPELERNFLPPEIEQDFWLLLVDMWVHEASSRPSSKAVLERLETMFCSLLEQHH